MVRTDRCHDGDMTQEDSTPSESPERTQPDEG